MGFTSLPIELRWAMGGIVALLVIATALVFVIERQKPHKQDRSTPSELNQRVRTWWLLVTVFLGALVLGRGLSIALLAFTSFLALKEFFTLIPARRADRRAMFWAYLAIPVQYLWVAMGWYGMFIIFIPIYMFLMLPVRLVMIGTTEGFLRSAGMLHWGLMTTVYAVSHAAFLLALRPADDPGFSAGPGLMLTLVFLTQANDVAQYAWGKTLGRRKIVPRVSPGKTWAGFLGGVGTTIVLAMLIAPWLTPMSLVQAMGAGAIIAVGGFFGDVTISAIKRDLGVKDAGSLLPGHGGILDRIDSLCFAAPLYFHYVYYLFLWHTGTA